MNFPGRVQARREAAAEMAEARSNRTDEQQLARLDSMLGEGMGARKERARLTARIAKRATEKPVVKKREVEE